MIGSLRDRSEIEPFGSYVRADVVGFPVCGEERERDNIGETFLLRPLIWEEMGDFKRRGGYIDVCGFSIM